jgi:hypothetical protein
LPTGWGSNVPLRSRGVVTCGPELDLHRLGRVAAAIVAGAARRRLPGRVAQLLGQLGAQRRLDHAARELRNEAARGR